MFPRSAGFSTLALFALATAGAPQGGAAPLKLTGWDASAVARAVDGAAERLEDEECQSLLDDFEDVEGHPLRATLEDWGLTPVEYLRLIPFLDGSRHPLCKRGNVALVTEVGVRRVYVCSKVFSRHQLRRPGVTESLIIHELLHTLGLGEDPPSSLEITQRVEARCR